MCALHADQGQWASMDEKGSRSSTADVRSTQYCAYGRALRKGGWWGGGMDGELGGSLGAAQQARDDAAHAVQVVEELQLQSHAQQGPQQGEQQQEGSAAGGTYGPTELAEALKEAHQQHEEAEREVQYEEAVLVRVQSLFHRSAGDAIFFCPIVVRAALSAGICPAFPEGANAGHPCLSLVFSPCNAHCKPHRRCHLPRQLPLQCSAEGARAPG